MDDRLLLLLNDNRFWFVVIEKFSLPLVGVLAVVADGVVDGVVVDDDCCCCCCC